MSQPFAIPPDSAVCRDIADFEVSYHNLDDADLSHLMSVYSTGEMNSESCSSRTMFRMARLGVLLLMGLKLARSAVSQ